jgi:hypothetical protein
MSLQHVISINPIFFILPDALEDVFSSEEMVELLGEDNEDKVHQSLKSINSVVKVDNENNKTIQVGNFSYQIISISLSTIKKLTQDRPEYLKNVISLFHLEDFLVIK